MTFFKIGAAIFMLYVFCCFAAFVSDDKLSKAMMTAAIVLFPISISFLFYGLICL